MLATMNGPVGTKRTKKLASKRVLAHEAREAPAGGAAETLLRLRAREAAGEIRRNAGDDGGDPGIPKADLRPERDNAGADQHDLRRADISGEREDEDRSEQAPVAAIAPRPRWRR